MNSNKKKKNANKTKNLPLTCKRTMHNINFCISIQTARSSRGRHYERVRFSLFSPTSSSSRDIMRSLFKRWWMESAADNGTMRVHKIRMNCMFSAGDRDARRRPSVIGRVPLDVADAPLCTGGTMRLPTPLMPLPDGSKGLTSVTDLRCADVFRSGLPQFHVCDSRNLCDEFVWRLFLIIRVEALSVSSLRLMFSLWAKWGRVVMEHEISNAGSVVC